MLNMHNAVIAGLWLIVFAGGGIVGRSIAWRRFRRRLVEEYDAGQSDAIRSAVSRVERGGMVLRLSPDGRARWCDAGSQWDRDGANCYAGFDEAPVPSGRRMVLLEPGPTIYRALVPVDDESLYGPESHVRPSDSTFIRTVLMDWERRYPIPQDSPNGNM